MRASLRVGIVTFALGGLFTFWACKQGENHRCQLQSDCSEGLVCSADGLCRQPTATVTFPDAAPLPDTSYDAALPDAAPIDAAPIDGPIDAAGRADR